MYPSKKDNYYGIFVKNCIDGINEYISTDKIVISGKKRGYLKLITYILFYTKILFVSFSKKYDIVYVHYFPFASIPLLIFNFFRPHTKIVLNAHGGDVLPTGRLAKLLISVSQSLVAKASLIVVPSKFFHQKIQDVYKTINCEIFISPSAGVNKKFFNALTENVNINEIFTIGYVSRIDYNKGWDVFIRAIEFLNHETVFKFKAIMVGGGEEVSACLALIKNSKLENIISYVGGKSQDELFLFYNQLDVFIFPTLLNESLGLVGIEAMASKVPVIASHIGGITDYLIDGINGYFFKAGDYKDLACKIKKYFILPEEDKKKIKENSLMTAMKYEANHINVTLVHKLFELLNT
jgi:glycosyltransferase involved in cell wall biosynthesis